MKIKTFEAAMVLGIHPAHFLLYVAELEPSLSFNEVWPEIDGAWVETVAVTGGYKINILGSGDSLSKSTEAPIQAPILSKEAVRVLDKLSRQGKWGDAAVSFDALINLTHVPKRNLEEVITELLKQGFLDKGRKNRGKISLNPKRRKDIDVFIQKDES